MGPKGAAKLAKDKLAAKLAAKKTSARPNPRRAPHPPAVAPEVFDEMATPTGSYLGLLNDAEVDLGGPSLQPLAMERSRSGEVMRRRRRRRRMRR